MNGSRAGSFLLRFAVRTRAFDTLCSAEEGVELPTASYEPSVRGPPNIQLYVVRKSGQPHPLGTNRRDCYPEIRVVTFRRITFVQSQENPADLRAQKATAVSLALCPTTIGLPLRLEANPHMSIFE